MDAKCMRCGDAYRLDPLDPYLPELCHPCQSKAVDVLLSEPCRFDRFVSRYTVGHERHPTALAIKAAWQQHMAGADSSEAPF